MWQGKPKRHSFLKVDTTSTNSDILPGIRFQVIHHQPFSRFKGVIGINGKRGFSGGLQKYNPVKTRFLRETLNFIRLPDEPQRL